VRIFILAFSLAFPVFAESGALVRCGQDVADKNYFELREVAGSYEFEYRETAQPGRADRGAIEELANYGVKPGHRYSMVLHAPKEFGVAGRPAKPTCRFSTEDAALFHCHALLPSTKFEIHDLTSGSEDTLSFFSLRIYNIDASEESVKDWQELQNDGIFEINSWLQMGGAKINRLPVSGCVSTLKVP
jgi:hypothetical protein